MSPEQDRRSRDAGRSERTQPPGPVSHAPTSSGPAVPGTIGRRRLLVGLALISLYLVWGSTYLGMRFAIESFPPLIMAGIRFFVAGVLLYLFLRLRGAAVPTAVQWRSAAVIGSMLLAGGTGGVAFAEQWVASGVAALMIALVPLLTVLFGGLWGHRPSRLEWLGILVGFAGVGLLNLGGNLRTSPVGALVLVLAAASWSLGSMWSKRLPLPAGLMSSATQMLAGGVLLLIFSVVIGENMHELPTVKAVGALVYLIVFGSFVGFSSYLYLLNTVRPALATSYAYVNPLVAVALGVMLAGERVSSVELLAMPVIVTGVLLVMARRG